MHRLKCSPRIRAVGVALEIVFRLHKRGGVVEGKGEVLYGEAAREPLTFVVGAYREDGVDHIRMVQVVGVHLLGQAVELHHGAGVGIEERAVGLETHHPAVGHNLAVKSHEACAGEAFGDLFHLRIGEGDPQLANLTGGKEAVEQFNLGAQESHVFQPEVAGLGGAGVHARALDVYSDEILVGIELRQSYRVLTLAAAQLKDDGIVVSEKLLPPSAQRKRVKALFLQAPVGVLKNQVDGFHLGELAQFILAHNRYISTFCDFQRSHTSVRKAGVDNKHAGLEAGHVKADEFCDRLARHEEHAGRVIDGNLVNLDTADRNLQLVADKAALEVVELVADHGVNRIAYVKHMEVAPLVGSAVIAVLAFGNNQVYLSLLHTSPYVLAYGRTGIGIHRDGP